MKDKFLYKSFRVTYDPDYYSSIDEELNRTLSSLLKNDWIIERIDPIEDQKWSAKHQRYESVPSYVVVAKHEIDEYRDAIHRISEALRESNTLSTLDKIEKIVKEVLNEES